MIKRSLDEIGEFLDSISKKHNYYFTLEKLFYSFGDRLIRISCVDKIPKTVRNEIKDYFNISTSFEKEILNEGILKEYGKIVNYEENTTLELTFWNTYQCKLIRKEKKIVKTKKVITPAVTEMVEEEKEIPVYEFPGGKIVKYD